MPPVITALYAALNALFNIFLANEVARLRGKTGVKLGTTDEGPLLVAIRAHGNNAEFVPLAIVMMLLAEMCGANHVALHVTGGLLLAARVAHWIGLPRPAPNVFRFSGVALTWACIVGLSAYVLYLRFQLV